jgi:hypothetical protein
VIFDGDWIAAHEVARGLHLATSHFTMSRLAGILVLILGASAFADTTEESPAPEPVVEAAPAAKSSKFPLRVVKILAESEQALLFDKTRGRHILVEVGEAVGDYTIASIDEEEVTLAGKDMPVEVVLAAPETRETKRAKRAAAKKAAAEKAATAPEDPYGESAPKAPADPYAAVEDGELESEQPIRAVTWGKEGEKSTTSPFATMDAEAAKPSADVANAGTPAKKPTKPAPVIEEEDAPKPAPRQVEVDADIVPDAPAVKADGPTRLSKKDVTVALNDFAALAASIDGSFTAKGLVLEKLGASSVFSKAGLQVGDVVTAVDGKPLKTIDDAADLYARAGSMTRASVQILRAGKPLTLRIAIQ